MEIRASQPQVTGTRLKVSTNLSSIGLVASLLSTCIEVVRTGDLKNSFQRPVFALA